MMVSAATLIGSHTAVLVRVHNHKPYVIVKLCGPFWGAGVWIETEDLQTAQYTCQRIHNMLKTSKGDDVYNERVHTMARLMEEEVAETQQTRQMHPFAMSRKGQMARTSELDKILEEVGLLCGGS